VISRPGALTITHPDLFAPGQEARTELFARRLLRVSELRALEIDPTRATATLRYRPTLADTEAVIGRLADAAARGEPLNQSQLPPWRPGEPVVFYRHGTLVSTLDILSLSRRWLHVRHPVIRREPATAQRIEEMLLAAPGVLQVTVSAASATVEVRFNPAMANGPALLRVIETTLLALPDLPAAPYAEHPSFTFAHLVLGVSALGDFVAPVVLPGAAGLLVWNNVGALRAGIEQVRDGELGPPVLYSTIMAATLLSGSFFSAALMFWFFRYWERRHRDDMAEENAALLGEILTLPAQARVVSADGLEHLVPSSEIEAGQRVRVRAGETIPVDATVTAGAALVNERVLGGAGKRGIRLRGDVVLAGSPVLAGQLDLAVLRSGGRTHAAQLAHATLATTVPAPSAWTLTPEAETFAARAVPPTLAAAVIGLLTGGVSTANAVLRPDYATGIGLTAAVRMLYVNRTAMRHGALVRTRAALNHLAAGAWVVLDDHEALEESEYDLAEFHVRGISEDQLLPAIAAAGAWLGDARGPALARACATRGLIARRARLRDIDPAGVAIDYGGHVLRLRSHGDRAPTSPLGVDVDGVEVARLCFQRNGLVPAAIAVRQLQREGLRVFLASGRTMENAASIARQIGADASVGSLDDRAKCSLLRALHQDGVAVLHVRDGPALPHARDNYVSIGLASDEGIRHDADIVLLGRSIAPLPALVALSRDSAAHSRQDCWTVVAPNLAGVAGVFAFDITGLTVVLISNLATYIAHERARRALADVKAVPSVGAELAPSINDSSPTTTGGKAPEPEYMRAQA
jgi:cation transport ATPase